VAGLCVALASWSLVAEAAEFDRNFTYQAKRVTVSNLIGSIRVEKATGTETQVEVHVRGADADAKWIQFDTDDSGTRAGLTIGFPLDQHDQYVYPKLGSGSRSSFSTRDHADNDWVGQLFDMARGDRIEVRGRQFGDALEIWADVVIRVPASREAIVQLGVGEIDAKDLAADLKLRVKSGGVTASGIKGDVLIDTGSGSVEAGAIRGDLDIDTGSGSVDVADVKEGRTVRIDTGSGHVEVADVACEDLSVDTGSGSVEVRRAQLKGLKIDTGSGGVDADEIAADDASIDTGSGGVTLRLVRMGDGRFDIETGSGGIRLDMPRDLSAVFDVQTSSGGIVADIEGVTLNRKEHNEAHFTVGGGDARVLLSTGSGSIKLAQGGGSATR
jgi:hypothetical protein